MTGFDSPPADADWMRAALCEAERAAAEGEVPVGAVIVREGNLVSRAHNRRETAQSALAHAEILAIDTACRALQSWRLPDCDLYVTLEPCPMCAGAVVNARVRRVIFGARDPKAGALGSITDIFALPVNHHPQVTEGVLEAECAALLRDFFRARRVPK